MSRRFFRLGIVLSSALLIAAGCGTDSDDDADDDASSSAPAAEATGEQPTIAVTTNILGDVVDELVGDQAEVLTIMPVGADPHDFQASAQEVDALLAADALIVNGAAFEEGLLDIIDTAADEGVATHEAIEGLVTLEFGEGGHDHDDEHSDDEHSDDEHGDDEHGDDEHSDDEHSDEEHSDDEHGDDEHGDDEHGDEEHSDDEHGDDEHSDEEHSDDEHGHDHEGADPHFFTDPIRMAGAVDGIVAFLATEVDGLDLEALDAAATAYIAELEALDAEVSALVASIPENNRVLVTNHEVFAYFADQYGFEVVGTVIPGFTTADGVSPGELAELAETIEDEGVPAIFSDTSSSSELVETLADEVGDIDVVELYTESLGDADSDGATYLKMVLTNAQRIAGALA